MSGAGGGFAVSWVAGFGNAGPAHVDLAGDDEGRVFVLVNVPPARHIRPGEAFALAALIEAAARAAERDADWRARRGSAP